MVDVSVLITCKDKEKYLEECINSVLRQTKQPREIIVVHDGCENPNHHAKVTSILEDKNYGVAHARDRAFKMSTGQLVLFVDGDDVLDPDYIEKMVLTIASGADITYPDIFIWNGPNSSLTIAPERLTKAFVKDKHKVCIPITSLMKRSVYKQLGGFKEMKVLEDLDFFVRALVKGFKFKKSHTLLWYRRYPETRNSIPLTEKEAVLKEILKQL